MPLYKKKRLQPYQVKFKLWRSVFTKTLTLLIVTLPLAFWVTAKADSTQPCIQQREVCVQGVYPHWRICR